MKGAIVRKRCAWCGEALKTNQKEICLAPSCGHPTVRHTDKDSQKTGCFEAGCECKAFNFWDGGLHFSAESKVVLSGYGYNDNGFFCTAKHGYFWACRALEERARQKVS